METSIVVELEALGERTKMVMTHIGDRPTRPVAKVG